MTPDKEAMEHADGRPGVLNSVAPQELVDKLSQFLPMASFSYAESKTEAEWMAKNHGYQLVLSRPFAANAQPAYCLMTSHPDSREKLAILSIRGTTELRDVLTNSRTQPVEFQGGYCHRGILEAAKWINTQQGIGTCLENLERAGHSIILTGHSLGAGVAVLMGMLLQHRVESVHVYAYACPACVDTTLADSVWMQQKVTHLIHRDDFIPRASIVNACKLATELIARQPEFKRDFQEDVNAVMKRAASIWAPAKRETKQWESSSPSKKTSNCKQPIDMEGPELEGLLIDMEGPGFKHKEPADNSFTDGVHRLLSHLPPWRQRQQVSDGGSMAQPSHTTSHKVDNDNMVMIHVGPSDTVTKVVTLEELGLCVMPGNDSKSACFSASVTGNTLTVTRSDVSSGWDFDLKLNAMRIGFAGGQTFPSQRGASQDPSAQAASQLMPVQERINAALHQLPSTNNETGAMEKFVECWVGNVMSAAFEEALASPELQFPVEREDSNESFVILGWQDAEAIRMVPPGKIVHTFSMCGVIRAALVTYHWEGLCRFELYRNSIEDHAMCSILDGMRNLRAARNAPNPPPTWQSMGDAQSNLCAVCHHSVTWDRTSSSESERMHHMHHCRSCGRIVCGSCSKQRMTIPSIGIINEVRVCDCCYWRGF